MIAVELRFPAGAYHANPWGRHVNEGVVEWPPSPFRLARALADCAFRRHPEWAPERIAAALEPLAGQPRFSLPPASSSHLRTFMNSNKEDPTKKQKIIDAFALIDRGSCLLMALDSRMECAPEQLSDLNLLLTELDYLGRSESWIEARLVSQLEGVAWNAGPADPVLGIGRHQERVQMACLRTPSAYTELSLKPVTGKGKKARDLNWLEAVCLGSGDIQEMGFSHHPALVLTDYARPLNALEPPPASRSELVEVPFAYARFTLTSTVLPRVESTLSVAERVRRHLMGIHKRCEGGDPSRVSPLFSGKDADGSPLEGHRHLFILPRDQDRDGRLDHLELWSHSPFTMTELEALDGLRSVWQEGGRPDIEFLLTDLMPQRPKQSSTVWESETPFVTARHYRKGRGDYFQWLAAELCRELKLHGLPEPVAVEWTQNDETAGLPLRWAAFLRSRKGQHPLPGYGARIRFEQPVEGPFAVGALCHYGLGLFRIGQGE